MEESEWNTASLTLHSDVLNCWEISEALNVQPSSCFNKGEPISRRNPSKKRSDTVWILESNLDTSEFLEDHIMVIVDFVHQNLAIIKQLSTQATLTIFCGYSSNTSQGGFILSPELLKKLGSLEIRLIVDLYFPEDGYSEEKYQKF